MVHIPSGILFGHKKSKTVPFAATLMELEIRILSEVSQRKAYDITYVWNLKYGTNKPIYRTETNSWRTDLWLPGGGEGGGEGGREEGWVGGWAGSLG